MIICRVGPVNIDSVIGKQTMAPEIFHSYVLFVYSLFFFGLALLLWRKKRRRLHALNNHNPCATYLRMRFETARLFDCKKDSSSSQSKFEALTLEMRYFTNKVHFIIYKKIYNS